MKRFVVALLGLVVGVVAGRMSGQLPANAEGGGGQEQCSSLNGDVDGSGTVDMEDVILLLACLDRDPERCPGGLIPLCARAKLPASVSTTTTLPFSLAPRRTKCPPESVSSW